MICAPRDTRVSFRPIRGFPFDDVVLSFDGAPLAEDFHLVALSGLAPLIGIEQGHSLYRCSSCRFFWMPNCCSRNGPHHGRVVLESWLQLIKEGALEQSSGWFFMVRCLRQCALRDLGMER